MAIVIYGLDSLILDVDVNVAGTQNAFDLTDATVDAAIDGPGDPIAADSVTIVNASQGLIRVTFNRGRFQGGAGRYLLQVRAQKGSERQTVGQFDVTVLASVFVTGQE